MELYSYEGRMLATPEEIFKVVNDDEKLKSWSPIFEGNEYLTEEKRAVGTKFRTRMKVLNRTYQFRSEITEYEAERYIKVKTVLRQGEIVSDFKLEPLEGEGTKVRVTSHFDTDSRKYKLVLRGTKPVMKRVLDHQMKKLGVVVEA
ncbi:SRPBCC family protein [Salinicoccus bachuensis]|uniref:SRPBCC family protein n=1 Tax=Salinicoccus bachuensis TaxID=3136731 RepID=A0ABZ3CFQ9_9STAP